MRPRDPRHLLHRATTALFLGALALPLAWHLTTADDPRDILQENRAPAPRPQWSSDPKSWAALPKALEDYYRDFVRGRTSLLRTQRLLRWGIFGETPVGSQTLRGKDDWIFFTGNDALAQHRGEQPWSEAMLARACDVLERRRALLAERGMRYLFVVAPDKMSIFPEMLPEWALPRAERTPIDQLVEATAARGLSDVLLDLRPTLRARKGTLPIYYARGTHWTALGAYHGYVAIAERLRSATWPPTKHGQSILALPAEAVRLADTANDSWGERWHLREELSHTGAFVDLPELFEHRLSRSWWPQVAGKRTHPDHLYLTPRRAGSSLLVFHDSFWDNLVPYFTNHFAATAACSTYGYDPLLARAFGAQVVLHVCVERNLWEPFREELERASNRAWLPADELGATYRSPRWDALSVGVATPGELAIDGTHLGAFRAKELATGIYAGVSPLLGPLQLAFFREAGAGHLVLRPPDHQQVYSFLADSSGEASGGALDAWAGRYESDTLVYDLVARGGALWVFDERGEIAQVLSNGTLGATGGVRTDPQTPDQRWTFSRGVGTEVRMRLELSSAPDLSLEFVRRGPSR